MTIGDVIAKYRKDHDMSMDKFATISGLSKAYISVLERNKTQRGSEPTPSIDTFRSVASAIGMDTDELIRMVDGKIKLSTQKSIPDGFDPLPPMKKVPLIGQIACGEPITAEENIADFVDVPAQYHCDFCLKCVGDSMIEANINDGDIVYIRKQPTVENGDIAAVRIGEEATLKRVYLDGECVVLAPANSKYPPRSYRGQELENIHIEGKAVGFTHWF